MDTFFFENQTRNDAATAIWSDPTDRFRARSIDERDSRPRLCSLHYYGNSKRLGPGMYCKSRIFRMHVIFVYFVRAAFRTKIKCMRKVQSMPENQQRSATVRKFHAYERSESPGYENWVRTKYSGFTVYSKWPQGSKLSTSERTNSIAAPQTKNDWIFCFSSRNATSFTQDYVC